MSPIQIDGSSGEGGGQMLRSALSLSILTGKPFRMERIRAKRAKPGLMRQHLTCVRAAAEICGAAVEGDVIKSQELSFRPGPVKGGEYRFAVGTAGSSLLVFQTVALPLLYAKGASIVQFEGGTHNSKAPTFDFVDACFLPVLRRMGAKISIELNRAGFYPAGQGRFMAEIEPLERLSPIELMERGALIARRAEAGICNIPETVGKRELSVVAKVLDLNLKELAIRDYADSAGAGNVLSVRFEYEGISEILTAFGEKGLPAEAVARRVINEATRYAKEEAPVGDHLADQLLLPFALAGGGHFRTLALSQHFLSNQEVIEKFLPVTIETERESRLCWRVAVRSKQASNHATNT